MNYLSQILGNSLLGIINGHSAAQISQMTSTLRTAQIRKGRR
ncbi:hypothetical protein [Roseibium limicola]|nr:hypothetical protein [Roseibium limicola]